MFNEDDEVLMRKVAENVSRRVVEVFPDEILVKDETAKLLVTPGHQLSETGLKPFLDLIDTTLGTLYSVIDGRHWRVQKLEEMRQVGLVYIAYSTDEVACFVSVMVVLDHGVKRLYLYEIHVDPFCQHSGLGSFLMDNIEKLVVDLDSCGGDLSCKGISLTVFTDNKLSYNWYLKRGFTITENSPQDKVLRNGTVRVPIYYLMTRDII